jgi:hypothetical protein
MNGAVVKQKECEVVVKEKERMIEAVSEAERMKQ